MTELRWHPRAAQEAQAARRWYALDQDAPDVAEDFMAALRTAVNEASRFPERWPVFGLGTRKRSLQGFPHAVVYQVREDHVLIVAVMHGRRRPNYWRKRIIGG